jgi:hypothetical protein
LRAKTPQLGFFIWMRARAARPSLDAARDAGRLEPALRDGLCRRFR